MKHAEDELSKESTSAKIAQVQLEENREVSRQIEYYNLDAIISVGYRVNSRQATASIGVIQQRKICHTIQTNIIAEASA